MKNGNNEKLDNLLRQFMDEAHMRNLKADLDFADQVFEAHPVPDVRQETLAAIQGKIHRMLLRRRFLTVGKWISGAAAVLVVALLSHSHFISPPNKIAGTNYSNESIWKSDFYAMNSQVDSLERELAELAGTVHTSRLDAFDTTGTFSVDMKELDEIEHLTDNLSLGKGNFYAQ